jgi:hypothetical protein
MKLLDYPLMLLARTLLLALYLIAFIPLAHWVCWRGGKKGEFRYLSYLLINFTVDVFATLIAPLLPLFATVQLGASDNGNARLAEPRLPKYLSWFQTPDNSLYGDTGWQTIHYPAYKSYLGQVLWLIRNSAHGLVNGPLSAKFDRISDIASVGNPWLDRNNPDHSGLSFTAQYGDYFQWMKVVRVPILKRSIYVNIGWHFDPFVENPQTTNAHRAPMKFSIKPGAKL